MAPTIPAVLDRRSLNRALLQRQLLLRRAALPAADALEHLVGQQAQAPAPPYVGLWTRLDGFAADDLATLIEERAAVRLVLQRGTIHLVTARDALTLRPVLAGALERTLTSAFGRKLTGLDHAEVASLGRRLVEEQPLTLGNLGGRLAERWPQRDAFALANTVRALVPLVQVPPRGLWGRGGPAAHTTAEAWLGRPQDTDAGPDALVARYLAAFGPATVQDMQTWSGMTRLAAVFQRLRTALRTFRDEQGRELFDVPDGPLPDADTPAPVRFLPEFDNILLSHADRGRILTDTQRRLVFTRNGLIKSTVLVDGFVRGVWRIDRAGGTGGGTARLVIEPFGDLARRERAALAAEGERLLAFAAAGATVLDLCFENAT
ncbi:winged helix DNA-binding domain-containing protein [Streptomyces sp. H27-D2]|uniref:winged helix DNA-binding domain-containing protein n=1 Tax=Streptomyces sp. H27-D2 TaxID=3046304 RepID=UPI002DB9E948|nr:winged helix DNA-binding domain-containing protein [Streptomyces sp. H27-D2]MEC4015467.1 winged helix DNA-binding domain-containing protein [Streptomyces sp. H27-D2]